MPSRHRIATDAVWQCPGKWKLVEHNFGKMDGFLQRPTAPANNPGVTAAAANTFRRVPPRLPGSLGRTMEKEPRSIGQ